MTPPRNSRDDCSDQILVRTCRTKSVRVLMALAGVLLGCGGRPTSSTADPGRMRMAVCYDFRQAAY